MTKTVKKLTLSIKRKDGGIDIYAKNSFSRNKKIFKTYFSLWTAWLVILQKNNAKI